MTSVKVLNPPDANTRKKQPVISAGSAADRAGVARGVFLKAIDTGTVKPQAEIRDEGKRPSYGFEVGYIDEIAKVLPPPKEREGGKKVFPPVVVSKIEEINKRWAKLYPSMRDR